MDHCNYVARVCLWILRKEYLDAMPESGYALKPTPEMRSFAEQMLHLTDANYGFAAAASVRKVR